MRIMRISGLLVFLFTIHLVAADSIIRLSPSTCGPKGQYEQVTTGNMKVKHSAGAAVIYKKSDPTTAYFMVENRQASNTAILVKAYGQKYELVRLPKVKQWKTVYKFKVPTGKDIDAAMSTVLKVAPKDSW